MAFITSSQTSLGQLIQQGNLTSTFHNIFIYLELGNFTEHEARMLLARNTDYPFSEEEISKLFKLAGYHPAHLQIVAQLLYDAKVNQAVNWTELKAEYEKRVKEIKPFAPNSNQPKLFQKILRLIFIEFPTALGGFVLEILKNKDASDRTAAILGWAVLLGLAAFLLGWLNIEALLALWISIQTGVS